MSGGIYYLRLIGGIVIWLAKGFKTPLKECIDNEQYAGEIGFASIILIAYTLFHLL